MNDVTVLTEAGTNELEVIEFHLDAARETGRQTTHYAINVTKVLEIIRKPAVTSMPSTTSACVLGTFNYRGRVIPLLDMKRCFNQPDRAHPLGPGFRVQNHQGPPRRRLGHDTRYGQQGAPEGRVL